MFVKLIVIFSISSAFIFYGVSWFRKGVNSDECYDFKDDLKHSFLTLHGKYSGFFNDGKPRRIIPAMLIVGGGVILIVGLINIL
jgi:hypothetical protein